MTSMGQSTGPWLARVKWGAPILLIALEGVAIVAIPIRPAGWAAALVVGILFLLPPLAAYLLAEAWLARREQGERITRLERRAEVAEAHLGSVFKLNEQIAGAGSETALLEAVLDLIVAVSGAQGGSFVPLDEWGQPLPALTRGDIPPSDLAAWNQHLSQGEVRERCRECRVQRAGMTSLCLLADSPFHAAAEIYCLPLRRGERMLGMVNLYLPAGVRIDAELRSFLDGLLVQMVLALETLRLRSRELSTLRQLQLTRLAEMEPSASLETILEEVQEALEGEYAALYVPGKGNYQQKIDLKHGALLPEAEGAFEAVLQAAIQSGEAVLQPAPPRLTLLATPLLVGGQTAIGALLVAGRRKGGFGPRQVRFLQTVATQCALLIENEHLKVELEYKAILDERTRLAREIHDGLAQTLAFLKLQVGQMQHYLKTGATARLREAISTSYQTLSDAYLDARQSIDHLRITPQAGLQGWLEQTAQEFRETTGMEANLDVQPAPYDVAVEVQLQLIRIVQEALNNVRKHAHAKAVWISLRQWNRDLILEVRDDGEGFAPEDVPGISQYGLRGMRERSELIGADFQIISRQSIGTTVRLRLPYPLEETRV